MTASDAQHGYRLTTTYIADPGSDTVLMHTRLSAVPGSGTNVAALHLYARLDAHVNGNGGGGAQNAGGNTGVVTTSGGSAIPVVSSTNTVTNATNRTYAVPTFMALADSTPAPQASVGFAGTASDGLTQLDTSHALTPYTSAPDGHIVATQELSPGPGGTVTLALGFGARTRRSPARSWPRWPARGARRCQPGPSSGGEPAYFGSYREVFSRDLYEAFTGLLTDGDLATARDTVRFLLDRQQLADGAMPRNSLLNGQAAPDTGGLQLDEVAYPILMDYQAGLAGDAALWAGHVRPAADFLVANGPSDGNERWEEQTGYSPSTIAAEIAGLTAASAHRRRPW